jgi:hypothetical protein
MGWGEYLLDRILLQTADDDENFLDIGTMFGVVKLGCGRNLLAWLKSVREKNCWHCWWLDLNRECGAG